MQRASTTTIIVAAALLTALAGCGAGSEARTPTERYIAAIGEQTDLFNELADVIGGIESQANANTVATRLAGEFQPRTESILGSMLGILEAMTEVNALWSGWKRMTTRAPRWSDWGAPHDVSTSGQHSSSRDSSRRLRGGVARARAVLRAVRRQDDGDRRRRRSTACGRRRSLVRGDGQQAGGTVDHGRGVCVRQPMHRPLRPLPGMHRV